MTSTEDATDNVVIFAARPAHTDGAWTFDATDAELASITAAVAGRIPASPPSEWFDPDEVPVVGGPLTFEESGRVYGLLAPENVDHIGLPRPTRAPKSSSGYAYFHTGQVRCADKSLVATGRITMLTGHEMDPLADAQTAAAHYDNTGAAVADVVAWDTPEGVMCAGAARPGLTAEQIRMAMASPPSGDWRPINGKGLEMVSALLVNVPGFPTSRAAMAASGELRSLVASGCPPFRIVAAAQPTEAVATPQAPKPKTPDLSRARSPEEIVAMTQQHTPEPTEDDDESLAAAGPPFAKGEPAPDDGDSGASGYDPGDTVMLAGSELPFQVTGETDNGDVVIEATVPADQLEAADEAMAAAAYARFDERQQDRVRDSKLDKLTAAVEGLVASGQAQQETIAAQAAHIDTLQRERNSAEASRLLASAGIE